MVRRFLCRSLCIFLISVSNICVLYSHDSNANTYYVDSTVDQSVVDALVNNVPVVSVAIGILHKLFGSSSKKTNNASCTQEVSCDACDSFHGFVDAEYGEQVRKDQEKIRIWNGLSEYKKACAPYSVSVEYEYVYDRSAGEVIRNFCKEVYRSLDFTADWSDDYKALNTLDCLASRIRNSHKFRKRKIGPLEQSFGDKYIDDRICSCRTALHAQIAEKRRIAEEVKKERLCRIEHNVAIKRDFEQKIDAIIKSCDALDENRISLSDNQVEELYDLLDKGVNSVPADPIVLRGIRSAALRYRAKWPRIEKEINSLGERFLERLIVDVQKNENNIVEVKTYKRLQAVVSTRKHFRDKKKSYELNEHVEKYAPSYFESLKKFRSCKGLAIEHNIQEETVDLLNRHFQFLHETDGFERDLHISLPDLMSIPLELRDQERYEEAYSCLDFCSALCDTTVVRCLGVLPRATLQAVSNFSTSVRGIMDRVADLLTGGSTGDYPPEPTCPHCGCVTMGFDCVRCSGDKSFAESFRELKERWNEHWKETGASISNFVQEFRSDPEKTSIKVLANCTERVLHVGLFHIVGGYVSSVASSTDLVVASRGGPPGSGGMNVAVSADGVAAAEVVGGGAVSGVGVAAGEVLSDCCLLIGAASGGGDGTENKTVNSDKSDLNEEVEDNFSARITGVPDKAYDTLDIINETGEAPDGYRGGRAFMNDGRGGGQVLLEHDSGGRLISYKEWDIDPYQQGVSRGTERLVTGSDGSAYYTSDHYNAFVRIK